MADETTTETTEEKPPAPPPPPSPDTAALQATIAELKDTVKALAGANPRAAATAPTGTSIAGLHPLVVQHARAKGMTDAEIERNGPLIAPLVEGYLGLVGPEIMGGIASVREELEEVRLSGNVKDAPHYDLLKDEVKQLRADAKNRGETLSLKAAYAVAVVNNIDKIVKSEREKTEEPAVATAPARRAAAASNDVGGRGSRSAPSSTNLDPRTTSSNDLLAGLSAMSAADRKKWYDQHGDIPL